MMLTHEQKEFYEDLINERVGRPTKTAACFSIIKKAALKLADDQKNFPENWV